MESGRAPEGEQSAFRKRKSRLAHFYSICLNMAIMSKIKQNTLAVVGLGYVGLPLALLADRKGYRVTGIDIDENKIRMINEKLSPFGDERITQELQKSRLEATSDSSRISESNIIVVCVPTPVHEDYSPNLYPVSSACESIGRHLRSGQLIILESTVNPGVSETVVQPILERSSGLRAGVDFFLAHCPERINPGDKKWDIENINRVIGALSTIGLNKAIDFYKSIIDARIKPMGSLKEAEAVKVVENSFRDINIAFVNELAQSFSHLGIDVVNVIEGAATKPFAFLPHYPGAGVGGHCIPVDPYYLIDYAKRNGGFSHNFLSLARKINSQMPEFTAKLAIRALREKGIDEKKASVSVLGLAYKPNIDDDRESPSYEIIRHLEEQGVKVFSYDPYVFGKSTEKSLEDSVRESNAVIIATAHNEFLDLSPEFFKERGIYIVIDGRNCLPKETFVKSGLVYIGIGR